MSRNQAADEICGGAGGAWRDGWPGEVRPAADGALAAARAGETARFRARIAWGLHGQLQVDVVVTSLFGADGVPEGFSATARDVTQEIEAAAFLANIGHEIRTPLHGLVAGTAILEARSTGLPERELAGMMRASALALAATLQRILGDPSSTASGPASPAAPDGPTTAPGADGLLQILVADDHPTNLRVVELILGEMACVRTVNDGRQAIEAFAEQSFDLVLMDVQMPVMDGVSAVSQIRRYEIEHNRRRTPIAMLTANVDPENVAASRAAGADRHIAKPFTPDHLVSCVQELLQAPAADALKASSWPPPRPPSPRCAA
ncbi:MAG: response regulator [Caulobacteraceae bacterium]